MIGTGTRSLHSGIPRSPASHRGAGTSLRSPDANPGDQAKRRIVDVLKNQPPSTDLWANRHGEEQPLGDVSIGKFDILATYVYARGLIDGLDDGEAKQRGMVAAIMGAQAKLGIRKEHHEEFQAQKEAAEKKKKTTITAESFDKQVAHKMGKFFADVFLPTLKKLVEAGAVLRRGETARQDPVYLGSQDQQLTVPGADICLFREAAAQVTSSVGRARDRGVESWSGFRRRPASSRTHLRSKCRNRRRPESPAKQHKHPLGRRDWAVPGVRACPHSRRWLSTG